MYRCTLYLKHKAVWCRDVCCGVQAVEDGTLEEIETKKHRKRKRKPNTTSDADNTSSKVCHLNTQCTCVGVMGMNCTAPNTAHLSLKAMRKCDKFYISPHTSDALCNAHACGTNIYIPYNGKFWRWF